ncbi:MAG: hypothetical protein FJY99_05635 [Candidatus Sericytochromatia bacterium]|nr:hypothetical protein [Candidatus Tanganyikabacteria bacterium]
MDIRRLGFPSVVTGPLRAGASGQAAGVGQVKRSLETDRLSLGAQEALRPAAAPPPFPGYGPLAASAASRSWIAVNGRPVGPDAVAAHKATVDAAHAIGTEKQRLTDDLRRVQRQAMAPGAAMTSGEFRAYATSVRTRMELFDRGLGMLKAGNMAPAQAQRLEQLLAPAAGPEGLERTPQEVHAALADCAFLNANPEPHDAAQAARREATVAATLAVSTARQDWAADIAEKRAMVGRPAADGQALTGREFVAYRKGREEMMKAADKALKLLGSGKLSVESAQELSRMFSDMNTGAAGYTPQELRAKMVGTAFERDRPQPLDAPAREHQAALVSATLDLASLREDIRADLANRAAQVGRTDAEGKEYTPQEHQAFVLARTTALRQVEEGLRLLEHGDLAPDAIARLQEAFTGQARPDGMGLERTPQEMEAVLAEVAYAARRRVPVAEAGAVASAALRIGSDIEDIRSEIEAKAASVGRKVADGKAFTPGEFAAWSRAQEMRLGLLKQAQDLLRRGDLRPEDAQRIAGMLTRTSDAREMTPQEVQAALSQAVVRGRQAQPNAPEAVNQQRLAGATTLALSSAREDLRAEIDARAASVGRKNADGKEVTPQAFRAWRLAQQARIAVVDDALRAVQRRELGPPALELLQQVGREAASPRQDGKELTTLELRERLNKALIVG